LGSIVLIFTNYDEVNVERNGKVVKMQIKKLPRSCIGAKVRYFVTYSYEGNLYDRATRGDFCEKHHVGELIDMKFLEGSKTILRPDESAMTQIVSSIILGLFGLVISISQWRKMRSFK
jgi:hypothetical protein